MPQVRLKDSDKELMQFRIETIKSKRHGGDVWSDTAERMIDIYKGEHFPQTASDLDRITVNYGQVNVDIAVDSIAYTDPEFMLEPMEERARQNAEFQKSALKKVWNEIDALIPARRALQDCCITGKGVCFVGWRFETAEEPPVEGETGREPRPDFMPQEGALPTAMLPPPMQGMMPGGAMQMAPPPVEYNNETTEEILYDNPIVRRINPLNFYVDPEHDDLMNLRDAGFVVEEFTMPLDDAKAQPKWKHTSELQGDETIDKKYLTEKTADLDAAKRVRLFSYWQKSGRIHAIVADELPDKPLLVEKYPYKYESYPYVTLIYRQVPNHQDPQGQIEPAETVLMELDKYRTIRIRHDDKFGKGRLLYNSQVCDANTLKALRKNEDGGLIPVKGPVKDAISPVPDDQIPQEVYLTEGDIKRDISALMAVDDWMRGTPDRTRRTKGEVQSMMAQSGVRAQTVQRDFERFVERIADMILRLLQDERFCDRKRWMIVSSEGMQQQGQPPMPGMPPGGGMPGMQQPKEQPVTWNYRNVMGDTSVNVCVNSTHVQTPESLQSQYGYLLQSVAPFVQSGLIDPTVLIEEAGKAFGLSPLQVKRLTPQGGGGQQQVMEAIKMLAQGLMEVKQATDDITQQLAQGQMDAKTQMALAKTAQHIQAKGEEHQMKMQQMHEEHQMNLSQSQENLQMAKEQHQTGIITDVLGSLQGMEHSQQSHELGMENTRGEAQQKSFAGAISQAQGHEMHQVKVTNEKRKAQQANVKKPKAKPKAKKR
jgi:hypothetical protein